ncbi:protein S100-G-like [Epinephelus moara]|uniref:protein S100-G-like n=1 Tax=Epinephelus moara TaxID=300413 RepID=UPI00214EF096|nr:protein S100-G-like [Epinephelus moara]
MVCQVVFKKVCVRALFTNPSLPPSQHLYFRKFSYNLANMAHLREALELLTDTFKEYAGRGGDKNTMSKAEIRVMLRKEFPNTNMDTAEMKHFFNKMDADGDGVVSFKEFVLIVKDFKLIYT